ncbi:uncharacterized protein LOC108108403 [Drosophila eugracilis]|uniref:uncharacterized protein LOC108108403 n=1 Tax=Drosophila eugracilis TaxID=29029 RepID=UPI0007E7E956|nr:uncharacterized protein LOC108108403 [Drosophila eugracilis]
MHQLPLKNLQINFSMFRKFSGYRPFMYNVTVDFCEFIRHPKRSPWFSIVHSAMFNFTNLNHSCPYDVGILVYVLISFNMVLNDQMLEKTPFPTGSYMFQLIFGNSKPKGITQIMTEVVEVE